MPKFDKFKVLVYYTFRHGEHLIVLYILCRVNIFFNFLKRKE